MFGPICAGTRLWLFQSSNVHALHKRENAAWHSMEEDTAAAPDCGWTGSSSLPRTFATPAMFSRVKHMCKPYIAQLIANTVFISVHNKS